MKLLLSSLLLASLCALSSWSTPVLTQTPDLSVTEGETVNVTCCWTWKYEKMRLTWLKKLTVMKTEMFFFSLKETSDCSRLTFLNVTREDSGRYICRLTVEIPFLKTVEGNGTVITVTPRSNTTNNTMGSASDFAQFPMIVSLAVMASLLLISLVCFCCLRRRKAQAARVIYEVPHIDSEEAEMDKHSTSSSRGSSQWCQVPVYESFDYFERVQTKDSG